MLANSLRQLSKNAASRALISQSGAQSLAPFASAAAQPSDPKTVLAVLYKAGPAAEEKRLLGMQLCCLCAVLLPLMLFKRCCCHACNRQQDLTFCVCGAGCVENELGLREWLEGQGHKYIVTGTHSNVHVQPPLYCHADCRNSFRYLLLHRLPHRNGLLRLQGGRRQRP